MTGRTNITGGGMNLNAEVQEFTVANGKNVVSGDFVEHYTTTSEKVLTSSEFSTYDHVQIGNGMCLCQSNDVLFLLGQTESGLDILDAYNEYSVLDFEALSDGSVAVCIKENPRLVRLKISGERFQYVCAATGTPETIIGSEGSLFAVEHQGGLYVFFPSTQTVPDTNQTATLALSVYLYDISQLGLVEYVKTIAEKITTTTAWQYSTVASGRNVSLRKPFFVAGYLCVATDISWLSGSVTLQKKYITKFEGQGIEYVSETGANFGTAQRMKVFHDKYLVYAYDAYIGVFNVRTEAVSTHNLKNFGFKNDDDYFIRYSKIGDDKIAVFFAETNTFSGKGIERENGIFTINSAAGGILLASNIFNPAFTIHGTNYNAGSRNGIIYLDGIVNDLVYHDGMTCVCAISYNEDAELLTEKVNKSYVQPYTGGLSIGVAKQSGKSGQTIEVYIAKPSA